MVFLVSTVCILSMTLITYLSNMTCRNRVVSWANMVCVYWTGHDALVSALINDVATPPIVASWIGVIRLTFLFNHGHMISILNFPVNDLCHDSIGNKQFGFVFSRSDEPIVIGVCGMQSTDHDYRDRIWADRERIVSGIGPLKYLISEQIWYVLRSNTFSRNMSYKTMSSLWVCGFDASAERSLKTKRVYTWTNAGNRDPHQIRTKR